MQTVSTTRLSSKGQVVIPESIRKTLHLEAGNQFIVVAEKDVVILKTIQEPPPGEFAGLIRKARRQAKAAGMKKADIADAIHASRS
jgi:AbrB family looped-hinge helix DNA binding protein